MLVFNIMATLPQYSFPHQPSHVVFPCSGVPDDGVVRVHALFRHVWEGSPTEESPVHYARQSRNDGLSDAARVR